MVSLEKRIVANWDIQREWYLNLSLLDISKLSGGLIHSKTKNKNNIPYSSSKNIPRICIFPYYVMVLSLKKILEIT